VVVFSIPGPRDGKEQRRVERRVERRVDVATAALLDEKREIFSCAARLGHTC